MKNLKKLGKALSKVDQKQISGGRGGNVPYIEICGQGGSVGASCSSDSDCCPNETCQTTRHPDTSFQSQICVD